MVNYINDDGFIFFKTIGGFDLNIIPGRRVRIHTKNGVVPGVTGKKAIHVMTEEDRKKKLEIQDLWIDIGVKDKKEAESLVRVGDPITYAESFEVVRGAVVASRAFDDKAGSFAVGEVLRLLAGKTFDAAVYSVSTVQEEVGLRGARTSAYGIDPKIGVAVDVCHATDHPDMDRKRVGEIKLGGGPAIARGPTTRSGLNWNSTQTWTSNASPCAQAQTMISCSSSNRIFPKHLNWRSKRIFPSCISLRSIPLSSQEGTAYRCACLDASSASRRDRSFRSIPPWRKKWWSICLPICQFHQLPIYSTCTAAWDSSARSFLPARDA